ncbi:hypothetical protein TPAU25S_03103 [Tsukamurella paurometabola]|uniref:DUF1648 domain-containing protein n=1 Tax=Tsukamurella paurometabola (strain ATCC 8368 / DSM 20162 / CCUG 35730 / CIP 100753 / JCM 10117 / KCTC 9821 / NBRC 16120 / NCIMB 702349 / NCTC 13040) TaxID=521096 RepID=D5UY83_TSUPD|nr:protein of unknown function DUF1648 [Tsukamurella paurometabola DSM 20162]SUP30604.1 Predicted membrane protein [Tsukamurella paurometabola]
MQRYGSGVRWRWWIFLSAVVLCAAAVVWAAVAGPDPFPMHFTFSGEADSWGSRTPVVIGFGVSAAVLAGLFAGLAAYSSKLPDSAINTPRRDVWLAPDHRAEFDAIVERFFLTVGTLVQLLLAATLIAAVDESTRGTIAVVIAVFAVAMVLLLANLIRRLMNPRREASQPSRSRS